MGLDDPSDARSGEQSLGARQNVELGAFDVDLYEAGALHLIGDALQGHLIFGVRILSEQARTAITRGSI